LYFDSNRLDQAEASERTAIEVFRQLDDGRGWYIRMSLAESSLRLKDILLRQERALEAEAALAQSLSLWTELGRDYPDRDYFSDRLSYVAEQLGEALKARGERVEAALAYRRSVDAECRLISREPANSRYHSDLRMRFGSLDALLFETGRATERHQVANDVMAMYRSVLAKLADDTALQVEFERFQELWMQCQMEREDAITD
jgi:hypothetical protein